ncbi:TonB-dependent copper receptor [Aromatoleum bremense]|uniref:TonB-dependent copper receptor n=1 Tax=Aromatoleum bremense TaxID=76115 RepID=UPI001FD4B58E|nr:TonB-dependent copper receptor [Aromatoleum bremense]
MKRMITVKPCLRELPLAIAISLALPAVAAESETTLRTVVVTAPAVEAPLTVTTDPKAPRQPLPAHDGADLLKSIPGFAVIRKGGTDGDPVFRGMSGSRLGILLDGQEILGGCGGRMDPPTAYVYPESYDRVTVLKGPQSVLYMAGSSAGVVLFERDIRRMTEAGGRVNGSLTFGSWGRNDQLLDVHGGNPAFYAQAVATRSDSDNYEDGDGKEVHSFYTRWSTSAALGWTPDDDTRLELSLGRSDGEAAYADRTMDGTRFERENAGLKFERKNLSPLLRKVEAQAYYSYIDHVMDNFSLRRLAPGSMKMLSNPDRTTRGGRFSATLAPADQLQFIVGVDAKDDEHTARGTPAYRSRPRDEDLSFERRGAFAEGTYLLNDAQRVIAGLRVDDHESKDHRRTSATRGRTASDTLTSGFARYESEYADGAGTWYAGLGHAERFPDFWEFLRANGAAGQSFVSLQPEKTTQLDLGTLWSSGEWSASVSGFYGKVDDFILLKWTAPAGVRNIDATTYGLESDVAWRFARNWMVTGSLAWVRGNNDTDHKALAQQPPLEARLAVEYNDNVFSYGALLRLVAEQDRFDVGSGGIVANGMDLGPTSGFALLSLNAGWRPSKSVLLTAGVDNVFDRTYREHLSKSGAPIVGYETLTGERINEPGRTFWVKGQLALDI